MYRYTYMWVFIRVFMCTCVRVCSVAWQSVLDPFGKIRTRYRRFGFVLVVDPIDWQFENRSWDDLEIRTGSCSEDQMTIQIQNRVISCECLFLCYFICILLSVCLYMLLLFFHVIIWCILSVWFPVSLHESSVSIHLIYLADLSVYWCHFLC